MMEQKEKVTVGADCPTCKTHLRVEADAPTAHGHNPEWQPKVRCKDGYCDTRNHTNREYKEPPKSKCSDCDQLNPHRQNSKETEQCVWCGSTNLDDVSASDLEDLNIPLPPGYKEPESG